MVTEDTAAFLADFGQAVTWAPSTGGAALAGVMIFDQADDTGEGGDFISRGYQVTYATADWPGLKRGEVLTISGSGYKLRADPRQLDTGAFSEARLTKV